MLSFKLSRDHQTQRLEIVPSKRARLQLHFSFVDPEFGFVHAKLQTWLPFPIQI